MKPLAVEGKGFIDYTWPGTGLRVMAERYTDDGQCELSFYLPDEVGEALIHTTRVNLMATVTMNTLAKRLEQNSKEIQWTDVLTYITGKTMEIIRRGEPAIDIFPGENDTLEVEYLLKPLIYLNHPTVIFGDYGSLKSLMALVIAYTVQLPYHDNNLGLTTSAHSTTCLYLDYEDDSSSFQKRWSALDRGFSHGAMPILHRRMTSPLADAVSGIQREILDKHIGLLIVDSLGPAARGDLVSAEPAIKYHAALRQLGVTSLTLAHTAKDQTGKQRSIFGSVFFTNLTRSSWEIKAEQETGEDEAIISLRHTKANLSRKHAALGYRFNFTSNSITVAKADLRDTALSGELPLPIRIKSLLRAGPLNPKAIIESLASNEMSVRSAISRLSKNRAIIKIGESWGLAEI
jgi:hypothetical protein